MAVDNNLLLMLTSSGLGHGEPDLGEKLLTSFLNMLFESGSIPAKVICVNSGIFLTTDGSPVISLMQKFADAGAEILSCGTCLEYFNRKDKLLIGQPTNMRDTVEAMLKYTKVLSP